jgi:hypothetical protein
LTVAQVLDFYFVEHRAKLLDVAALLDRVDRARPGPAREEDYRLAALRRAVAVLVDGRPERARRVLELLSDPTGAPLATALGLKAAAGAYGGAGGAAQVGGAAKRRRKPCGNNRP